MHPARILIIGDTQDIAVEIEPLLRASGYDVFNASAENLRESVDTIDPDLLLLDYQPGYDDLTAMLMEIQSSIAVAVVYLADSRSAEHLQQLQGERYIVVVSKPVQAGELTLAVQCALHVSTIEQKYRRIADEHHLNESRLEALVTLGKMKYQSLKEITDFALEEGVRLTGSRMGYLAFMNDDESVLTMHSWSKEAMAICRVEEWPKHYPVELTGLWGEAVRQRQPVITNDYHKESLLKKGVPEGHVPIMRHMNIPVVDGDRIVAVAGVGNKGNPYDESDVRQLQLLMTEMWHIVQRRKSDHALRESEEKYRNVVQNAIEAICVIQEGMFIYTNPEALRLFGYSEQEMMQLPSELTIHPDDREVVTSQRRKRLQGENVLDTYSHRIVRKDGEVRWVDIKAVTITWNVAPAVLIFLSDITKRKEAEGVLQDAHQKLEREVEKRTADYKKARDDAERANELKNEFLANISHELRTPMHHILNYSKYGMQKAFQGSRDKLEHYFSMIRTSGSRLLSLLNDLLDLSKMESGRMEYNWSQHDLVPIIRNLITEFAPTLKDNNVRFELSDTDLQTVVLCDEMKVSQVLRNLIDNAVKFTPSGRSIRIFFDSAKLPVGKRQTDKLAVPGLCVNIQDEGVGIPDDELELIFDKFIQSGRTKSNAGGTGLGLAICREIIEAHDGKIRVVNNDGEGATFSFSLPYEQHLLR